jgi:hypothetical protein
VDSATYKIALDSLERVLTQLEAFEIRLGVHGAAVGGPGYPMDG